MQPGEAQLAAARAKRVSRAQQAQQDRHARGELTSEELKARELDKTEQDGEPELCLKEAPGPPPWSMPRLLAPPTGPLGRRLRCLCLHSFRTSGRFFKMQLDINGWTKFLGDLVEFVFIDAPNRCEAGEEKLIPPIVRQMSEALSGKKGAGYFHWWTEVCDRGHWITSRYEETVEYLRARVAEEEFDGVLGFGQGAELAHQVLMYGAPFRFGVFLSGRKGRSDALKPLYEVMPPDVPTLHTLHENDPEMKPMDSRALAKHFGARSVLVEAPGERHAPPALPAYGGSWASIKSDIRAFFEGLLGAQTPLSRVAQC